MNFESVEISRLKASSPQIGRQTGLDGPTQDDFPQKRTSNRL